MRGVISRAKKQPIELIDIVIPDPGPGEVVVDIIACGVCHTDLTYREGGINDEYPFLLGHEAAGTVEAVGDGATHTINARDLAGTVVLVGVPTPDMTLEMPLIDFFSHGGTLKSSWYGDCLPERDFPTLISLYLQGRLPLDKFVTERIGLDQIEDAFHKMHSGEVLRSVIVL